MNITYREIQAQDYEIVKDQLVKLVEYIGKINTLRRTSPKPEFRDVYFSEMISLMNAQKGTVVVAVDDENVVGFGIGLLQEQSQRDLIEFKEVKTGLIPDLFVELEYRGNGIGKGLINYLETYFTQNGCEYSELAVLTANVGAVNLYRNTGYEDLLLEMRRKLS